MIPSKPTNDPESGLELHPTRIIAGVVLGGVIFGGLSIAERVNPSLQQWQATLIGYTVVFGVVAAVLLLVSGLGLVTSRVLARGTPPEELKAGRVLKASQFFLIYLGSLFVLIAAAFYIENTLGVPWFISLIGLSGIAFLVASAKVPWWWFYTIRRLGWFAWIQNDRAMQVVLAIIGIAAILFALLAPT